jgi:RimJ/RimL family protein N-acetyltransferase
MSEKHAKDDTARGPAYRVCTPRLVVRCWNPEDAPLLKAALDSSLEHLRPWMPWSRSEPQELDTLIARMRRWRGNFDLGSDFVYGIFNRDETAVWGGTGLHTRAGERAREIGYWIHVDQINRGLATEAAGALTKIAFEVDGMHRVEIHCNPKNERSAAVARKLGYVHEATLRQRVSDGAGGYQDSMVWTLLAEDYHASPAAEVAVSACDAAGREILSGGN